MVEPRKPDANALRLIFNLIFAPSRLCVRSYLVAAKGRAGLSGAFVVPFLVLWRYWLRIQGLSGRYAVDPWIELPPTKVARNQKAWDQLCKSAPGFQVT